MGGSSLSGVDIALLISVLGFHVCIARYTYKKIKDFYERNDR